MLKYSIKLADINFIKQIISVCCFQTENSKQTNYTFEILYFFILYQSWSAMMFFNMLFYWTIWSTLKTKQIHEKRLIYLWNISICNSNNYFEHARILFLISINSLRLLHWLISTVSCLLHFYRNILIINQILITKTRHSLIMFTFLHMNYQKNLYVIQIQTRVQVLIIQIILQMIHID